MRTAAATPEQLLQLIKAVAGSDRQALGKLYDLTSPILYGLLLKMLRRPEWAQEALQDCYIRVWQRAITYSADKGDPISWLIGNARYRALDLLKAAQERGERIDHDERTLASRIPATAPRTAPSSARGWSDSVAACAVFRRCNGKACCWRTTRVTRIPSCHGQWTRPWALSKPG